MRTQVGIVGAGPAGLVLSRLLHLRGITSVIVEKHRREHVEERVRAGVLEQGTVDLLAEIGVGARLKQRGLVHTGLELRFSGRRHRIDLAGLTGGRTITIYGQNEVVKDLTEAQLAANVPIFFDAAEVSVEGRDDRAVIRFRNHAQPCEVICDFIAGCDGYHGVCRASLPARALTIYERTYPFAWLGILAQVAPSSEELIYCRHDRGFALHSMRSRELTRLYLQCSPDDDIANWTDDRIWGELQERLATEDGWKLERGPILRKGITEMRSFVVEPMSHGRFFLAGDAAHIVPPTGAKGLNLAVSDVRVLARALADFYGSGSSALLDQYSAKCLQRVWRVQRFSWWMTSMLHRNGGDSAFDRRRQLAELEYVTASRAAAQTLAENYVGLPME